MTKIGSSENRGMFGQFVEVYTFEIDTQVILSTDR
jgi:hypothetical protein